MNPENPVLVERYRGGVLESFHRGVICIVNDRKEVIFSVGDTDQICFPRSALKFIQAIPVIESGAADHFGFTPQEIAILCGSHNGEKEHIAVVQSILNKIGLDKTSLKCGPQYPTLTEDKNALIKADIAPEDIHNNCSGKHSGFLALCVFKGYDIDSYLDSTHPIHQEILQLVSDFHDYPVEKIATGLDGCSAPIFSLPVYNQAIAYMKLVNPVMFSPARQKAINRLTDAVTAYPNMIAGKNRYCTELMAEAKGSLIGKTGADGVYSLGIKGRSYGICIKIDDGLMGPQYAIAQKVVEQLNILESESLKKLESYIEHPIINWNKLDTGTCKVAEAPFENFPQI